MRGSGGVGDGVQWRRVGMAHRCSEAARRSGALSRRCAARAAKRYGEAVRRNDTVKRHREASAPIRRSASAASASGCRMARTCAARRLGRTSGVGRLDASRPHANRHTRCRASSPRPRCLTRQRVVDVTLDAIESMRMHASSMGRLAARIMRAARQTKPLSAESGRWVRSGTRRRRGSLGRSDVVVGCPSVGFVIVRITFLYVRRSDFSCNLQRERLHFRDAFRQARASPALAATSRRIFVNHLKECCDGSSFVHQGSG
ncbi:Uncharacterised protein [Burkholderia pseudomallei]|nr:Uncharacterised protein [Burkholderia pseudomallei]CFT73404.1 Uncharacterised protein [Burkholderia pseudomallei]CPH01756.1 Uncharacterised protein [Burkholderia pseudomallei]